jgi:hypothetical protein
MTAALRNPSSFPSALRGMRPEMRFPENTGRNESMVE